MSYLATNRWQSISSNNYNHWRRKRVSLRVIDSRWMSWRGNWRRRGARSTSSSNHQSEISIRTVSRSSPMEEDSTSRIMTADCLRAEKEEVQCHVMVVDPVKECKLAITTLL